MMAMPPAPLLGVCRAADGRGNREDFADLIDIVLDHVEELGLHPYFYFGFATDTSAAVREVLEDVGLSAADYQTMQMTGALPLAETSHQMPDGFRLTPQISARFGSRMTELLPSAYPGAAKEEIEMIASIHSSSLRSSKAFLIEEEGEAIGFAQQFRWRDELRLLIALPQRLWGTPPGTPAGRSSGADDAKDETDGCGCAHSARAIWKRRGTPWRVWALPGSRPPGSAGLWPCAGARPGRRPARTRQWGRRPRGRSIREMADPHEGAYPPPSEER